MVFGLWRGKNGRREEERRDQAPVTVMEDAPKRDKQLNLKVSEDCKHVFAEIQRVQKMKAAALFEDMVGERAERLAREGRLEL
jgi:hypothetical protein